VTNKCVKWRIKQTWRDGVIILLILIMA